MENATKALLISAAVLIVIVIIALGVSLLKSVSNTTIQSQSIGEIIGNATNIASKEFKRKLIPVETIKNMNYYRLNDVLTQNKTREKIKVAGFIYKTISEWDDEHGEWSAFKDTCLATKDGETEYEKSQRIVDSDIYNSKDFINAKDVFKIEEETKEYLNKNVQKPETVQTPTYYSTSYFTHYDNEGYIDEIVFVCFGGVGVPTFLQQPFLPGYIF